MPNITLQFDHLINVSVQNGDIGYYVITVPVGPSVNWEATTTPHMTQTRESVIMIGPIINITTTSITCFQSPALAAQYGPPPSGSFIMFSKDNKANLSSLLGYFSLVKIRNNSTEAAELFGVGAKFVESSK